ncbi:MAG TPA: S8 family serine peptidase [Solirubrobacterales bacterium]|jgi:serine protease|nr:S8 family serine peptidase [Solirubrobacterales bacterium]
MRRLLRTLLPLAAIASLVLASAPAQAASGVAPARGVAPRQLLVKFEGQRHGQAFRLAPGVGVREAARALHRNPNVVYATPNYIATASASALNPPPYDPDPPPYDPNDSGGLEGVSPESSNSAGAWIYKQWNFLGYDPSAADGMPVSPGGIDAPGAWRNLIERGRPGAAGIVVAVLDSGIAYRSLGTGFRRSPDLGPHQFVPGYDFVQRDRVPLDESGHGTHVAGTIAEKTNNGTGVTGLAYRARLMPVRVLDRNGFGNAFDIAKGIRFATRHGAEVINMSFNFACGKRVPLVDEALREAFERGVVTVASAGNLGSESCVSAPATGPRVIGVGGTTEGGCLGDYSLAGEAIDLVAPGGGVPQSRCPSVAARPIYQVTLQPKSTKEFGVPANYVGTSMAAAHVSGVAAMVLASGAVNPLLPPFKQVETVARKLRQTARDLGLPRTEQGAGLVDAGAASGTFPVFVKVR